MRKVHITLVGSQPEPIYYVIKEINPDIIVYICSLQSKDVAENVKNVINLSEQFIISIDPTEANHISTCAEHLTDRYANDEVTLNITGGSKPWTFIFGNAISKLKNSVILFIDQNNKLWNYGTMTCSDISSRFELMTIFQLRNTPLTKFHIINEYNNDDITVCKRIEQARNTNPKVFKDLMAVLPIDKQHRLKKQPHDYFSHGNSRVEWNDRDSVVHLFLEKEEEKDKIEEFEFKSPHAKRLAFNSGWFELKIARILSRWSNAKAIYLNCVFTYNDIDQNEVDIIIDTGVKPLFVECKTHSSNTTDIDKFKSVVRTYGGASCVALFITKEPLKENMIKKCEDNEILPFSLGVRDLQNVQNDLFELLDKQLKTINAK